jgi:hypothetical protein
VRERGDLESIDFVERMVVVFAFAFITLVLSSTTATITVVTPFELIVSSDVIPFF